MAVVARYATRYPWPILLVAVFLTAVSTYVAVHRFKVINNVAQLLDKNSPANRDYLKVQSEFGTDESYLVLIRSPDPTRNRLAADRVAEIMKRISPQIEQVYCKIDFSKIQNRFLFLLPEEQLKSVETELKGTVKSVAKIAISLDLNSVLNQVDRSFKDEYLRDPKNWEEFKPFIEKFCQMLNKVADAIEGKPSKPHSKSSRKKASSQAEMFGDRPVTEIMAEHQYVTFEQGKAVLVVGVRGALEEGEVSPFTKTVAELRKELKGLEAEFLDVKFGLTGEPVLNDDELRMSTHDTAMASTITMSLIAMLFIVSYRMWARPVFAVLVLGMSMAWSFAFAMTAVGHFNIISFAVIPMVLGIGIDFGIQIMGRYEEELSLGHSIESALNTALCNTGVAVFTGGSTTAAAFFTICFNEFVGLRELGLIAGGSILLCLIGYLVVFPAILALKDRRTSAENLVRQAQASNWAFLAPADHALVRYPKAALLLTGIITILSVHGISKVRFDYNLLHLQNPGIESVRVLHEIFKISENSTLFASVIADDLKHARDLEKRLETLPSVSRVESITDLLPEDQEKKMPIIRRIVALVAQLRLNEDVSDRVDVRKAQEIIARLLQNSEEGVKQAKEYTDISSQAKMAVDVFSKLIPPLKRARKAMEGLSQDELNKRLTRSQNEIFGSMRENLKWLKLQKADRPIVMGDIPDDLHHRFISPSGKILLQVYSRQDIWEREANAEFVTQVQSIAPHASGTPVLNFAYIELLRTSFLDAAMWAFVAIVILIVLHFWNVRLVTWAIFPLVLAVIWRTGLMGWFNIPFNPANIVTLPLIIGIDVAYGVYIMDRFREDGCITFFSKSTGKAIIMTGLTAFFGFASLLVSNYAGLFSIGLLMSLGIAIGMMTTIVILPQVLALLSRKTGD